MQAALRAAALSARPLLRKGIIAGFRVPQAQRMAKVVRAVCHMRGLGNAVAQRGLQLVTGEGGQARRVQQQQ